MKAGSPKATERLSFREPQASDAGFYLELMNDADFHRFIGDRGLRSQVDMETYIDAKLRPSFESAGFGLWLVEEMSTGEAIGMCGLVDRDGFDAPDLGYAFLKGGRGKGFAQEAALSVLEYAKNELKLTSVPAYTHPDNEKSGRLLLKAGFVHKGTIPWPATNEFAELYEWPA